MGHDKRAFEGIRVVDVSTAISGPICSYFLGLLGADVIRVDNPSVQDMTRYMDSDKERSMRGMGWPFLMFNSNKKSIAINLKNEDGKKVFKKLIESTDVLVENFRPGIMEKLGLGPDKLKKINSRLIYCSISGFGQDSPISHYPAYDNIVQGISGLMSLSGTTESGPMRVGTPIVDCLTGLNSAFAIASALLQREKNNSGQHIDVAMADSILTMMSISLGEYLYEGVIQSLRGNKPITRTPFAGCFITKDGLINVAANTTKQAETLTNILGCPELLDDPRALEGLLYPEVGDKITETLNRIFLTKSAEEWEDFFVANRIPAGKTRNVKEILEHPHTEKRNVLNEIFISKLNQTFKVPGCGFKFEKGGPTINTEPPLEGEDSKTILKELGYSLNEIDQLFINSAIGTPNYE
jgi:CoA:oxalate CoA-transferase